jgi:hypothetical protein
MRGAPALEQCIDEGATDATIRAGNEHGGIPDLHTSLPWGRTFVRTVLPDRERTNGRVTHVFVRQTPMKALGSNTAHPPGIAPDDTLALVLEMLAYAAR